MPISDPTFKLPRLMLCEGPDDVAFFQTFIRERNLPPFHIKHTGKRGEAGGNTKFREALRLASFNRGFRQLSDILIVSDNDDDHTQSFNNIQTQIAQAGLVAPLQPLQASAGNPRVTVMMLPLNGEAGNFECVCEDAARTADQQKAGHVDTFRDLVGADQWPLGRRGKLWLRANLAARANNPFVFLGNVFREPGNAHLIPVGHASFQGIHDALAKFN